MTKEDSRGLERTTLMDTDTAEFADMSKFPFNLERVNNYGLSVLKTAVCSVTLSK